MDERSRKILEAIVDDYVSTCEPVGSKAIVERHNINLSSATVRHVMRELEDEGFLLKPHTSAGRVPSDYGYKAYVRNIMQVVELPSEQKQKINALFAERTDEIVDLIKKSVAYLADTNNFFSVALSPSCSDSNLEQLKLFMIESGRAVVVVVLSQGVVKDKVIKTPNCLDTDQLNNIAAAIEKGLRGQAVSNITLVTVEKAAGVEEIPEPFLNQVAYETFVAIKQAEQIDVYMQGSHKLLAQPDFKDLEESKKILSTIGERGIVAGYMESLYGQEELLEDDIANKRISNPDLMLCKNEQERLPGKSLPAFMIRIGEDISLKNLHNMSFISTVYRVNDKICGQIGVIGPKRMAYGKVISQISFINRQIAKRIADNLEESK